MKKNRKYLLAALVLASATLSPAAHADLAQVGHNIKETTVSAAKKTGHVAKEAGHATAKAAKAVGHGIANTARHGYQAAKHALHKPSEKEQHS